MATAHGARYASTHENFVARVSLALQVVAADVLAETDPNHGSRVPFAQQIAAGDRNVIEKAVSLVAALNAAAIDVDAGDFGLTDPAIEAAVAAAWNTLAGVDTGNTA